MVTSRSKTAVVIFNLGGPDGPGAVRPFLVNLFMDPAILRFPWPLRWLLAQFIVTRRLSVARKSYDAIGGGSPILELTRDQGAALQREFDDAETMRVFVAMRHWHPLPEACAAEVKAWGPERIVLLPLYPQFSTTTTGSFLAAWDKAASRIGLAAPTTAICCYPDEPGFITALARLTADAITAAAAHGRPLVLFSAHGLPKSVVAQGDPYQAQVVRTSAALVAALVAALPDVLGGTSPGAGFDHRICYQSRVGPVEWLGPYTDDEIKRAGASGTPLVVVPVAFVCEHSETLVELDIDYGRLAQESGVPVYLRVPTVATAAEFIVGLAGLARRAATEATGAGASVVCGCAAGGGGLCPAGFGGCPFASVAVAGAQGPEGP